MCIRDRSRSSREDILVICDLAHVAGWGPYYLHDVVQVSWVGPVIYGSCTSSKTAGYNLRDLSDLSVDDLSDVWKLERQGIQIVHF